MTSKFWHNQFSNKYRIQGNLQLMTALHISSGAASDDTDAPFIRNAAGIPFIPGTSLRGAVRSALERMLCGLGSDLTGLKACVLFEKECCQEKSDDVLKQLADENKDEKKEAALIDHVENKLCDLCRLFGTTVFASRICFNDAFIAPKNGREQPVHCNVRDGVAINRDTNAAQKGAKYDYEVIDPGRSDLCFSMCVTVENASKTDRKLIGVMMRLLMEGIYIGAKRSGGLGAVVLLPDSVRVEGVSDAQTAWNRLSKNEPLLSPVKKWWEVFSC